MTQLAKKASVDITAVSNLAIWGNHSATMYPDFFNAKISGQPVPERHQGRGVAQRRIHHDHSAARRGHHQGARFEQRRQRRQRRRGHRPPSHHPTKAGDWFSVAVCSPGDYGIEKGLIFSYPIRSNGTKWEIVQNVPLNDFSKAKIAATENELKEERALVADLLPK